MLRWLALAALLAAGCVSAAEAQMREQTKEFSISELTNPSGIWMNSTIIWVANAEYTDNTKMKFYAYHASNMSRYPGGDVHLGYAAGAIWSDGTTMWVTDINDPKILGYRLSDMERDNTKDFTTLSPVNLNPTGLWSYGTTMWVSDYTDNKVYGYDMKSKARVTEFRLDSDGNLNTNAAGVWSDCTTMWVGNAHHPGATANDKIYAYKMSNKERDSTKDFDTLHGAGNNDPARIWSDGTTMWVTDWSDKRVYAYAMHSPAVPCPPPPAPTPRVFVYVPPPDTTPPTVRSVERTGSATTTNHTLTWDVRFSESVRVGLKEIHTNYTSVANVTIPDLGMVHDTLLADVPGAVSGGSVSVDLQHPITSGLLIELVAPDCTKFTIHNQTTTFPYKLRQPYDLGDLAGVGAAGQWELHVSDHAKYWNGTLNGWTLYLESRGVVEGSGRTHTITQYVAGPGEYALSLDGFDIRDRAGNHLRDTEPKVNEPYHVVGAAVRACQAE